MKIESVVSYPLLFLIIFMFFFFEIVQSPCTPLRTPNVFLFAHIWNREVITRRFHLNFSSKKIFKNCRWIFKCIFLKKLHFLCTCISMCDCYSTFVHLYNVDFLILSWWFFASSLFHFRFCAQIRIRTLMMYGHSDGNRKKCV